MEQKLIRELLRPSFYPEPTGSVTLVQTHISYLFLTDNFVYKVKKPLDLGFLNFTTLDRRRFYCEEEVRLNRRLCPDVYLDVVKIREDRGKVSLLGEGRIIDYAVKMRRLPAERMLDVLLRENKVEFNDVRKIARTVAAFHEKADLTPEITNFGRMELIRSNWEENFRQTNDFVGVTLDNRDMLLIQEWVTDFLANRAEIFAARADGGFIRDCDGDIHAENICLDDRVHIFDCIEFNERFRYIDTAADIAFLLMDFDYHGRRAFSTVFTDEYIRLTGDTGLTCVLDFYKVYRAFVRGKVESFRLKDRQIDSMAKQAAMEKAKRHFRLARGYIMRHRLAPSLIIFSGLMGTGKSTVAGELAFELGLELLRSDVIRKELAGLAGSEQGLFNYNEGIYSPDFTEKTYHRLLQDTQRVLEAGESIIIDASFHKKSDRDLFRELAHKHGASCFLIQTTCPEPLVQQRLNERILHPGEVSDGRWELFHRQKEEFEEPVAEEGNMLRLDTSGPLIESINATLEFLGIR